MADFPILQFGTSRFLQAHVDLFVSEAMARDEAIGDIVVVQTTANPGSRRRLDAFRSGAPFRVRIRGLRDGAEIDREIEVASVRGGLDAHAQWAEVERRFCAARCIVSNTADRGYEADPADALAGDPPRAFPAKLARLLVARHRAGAAAPTLLPCELIPSNGAALRAAVLRTLDGWGVGGETRRWIAEECVWVNSLVDRIVSQPLEPVGAVAEPYALWAIEDRRGLVLPCRHPDMVVTDDLASYEALKLFILNLGHTYLAELWVRRSGADGVLVRQMLAEPQTRAELSDLYEREVLPAFEAAGMGERASAYREAVVERFDNPFLDHGLADIHTNHAAKMHRRFQGLIDFGARHGLKTPQPRLEAALEASRRSCHTG